ncbi:MAG: flagellar hook-associated protein FlgK, partial [Rhodobacterales bacterium CG_4_9_14_3_um_filter_71_31]
GFDAPRDAAGLVAGLASLREGFAAQAENAAAASRGAAATLTDEELSVTAVDTDAELRDLLAIEKAYAANARVLQVVDSLMQQILEI